MLALSRDRSTRSPRVHFPVLDDLQAQQLLDDVRWDVDGSGTGVRTTTVIVNPHGQIALAFYAGGAYGHLSSIEHARASR